ncbi:MAG: hypothetical protein H6815_02735 [Phycisphaeraceae bacterium]|nr:hypothetical protein [Phycisphaerales bacterium]MCB9859343.1 hypothetical protein [Phycisphaeraceae bacterium]
MKEKRIRIGAVCALGVCVSSAFAQLDHGADIGLTIENNQLLIGEVVVLPSGQEIVVPGERVFGADFAQVGSFVTVDEPGLFGEAGVFPAATLRFDVAASVLAWDGSAFLSPSASTMNIEYGPLSVTTGGGPVPGFGFDVGPAGFDEHYEFFLNSPASSGIYLLEMTFELENTGYGVTDSAFIVFNWGLSELEHDAAIEWVESNLVPSPGSMAICAVAPLFLRRRRTHATRGKATP